MNELTVKNIYMPEAKVKHSYIKLGTLRLKTVTTKGVTKIIITTWYKNKWFILMLMIHYRELEELRLLTIYNNRTRLQSQRYKHRTSNTEHMSIY